MPIPGKQAPAPKQSQVFFKPGVGMTTLPVTVPRKENQKTGGTASSTNNLVGSGSGSITVSVLNLTAGSYTVSIPLSLPTPLTLQTPASLVVAAPNFSGLQGINILSSQALPFLTLVNSAALLGASSVSAGQTVRQFLARVTFQYTNKPASGNLTISCSANLVTTG